MANSMWPDMIGDRLGRRFTFRDYSHYTDGAQYYQADLIADSGEEAGYLWFYDDDNGGIVLHDIEVYNKFGQCGLGSQLIQTAEGIARRLGKKKIVGHVDARSQLSGQKDVLARWYRRQGYTVKALKSSSSDYYGTLEKKI